MVLNSPRFCVSIWFFQKSHFTPLDAMVTFTMIHNWAEDVEVRPRTGAIVEDNGIFLSNYACMKPVKTLQMYPTAYCVGQNATLRFNTILFATRISGC